LDWDDYVSELTVAAADGADSVHSALASQRDRQRAWLKRRRPEATGSDRPWRPAKRHRKSAWQTGVYTHYQMSQFLDGGLFYFQVPLDVEKRKPAITWPRASLSPDMDSSNVSSASHWLYKLNLNIDFAWDFSHGVRNDIFNAIKDVKKWDHIVMALVRLNVPNSPWHEDTRWKQAMLARDEIFKTQKHNTCELFQFFLPELLADGSTSKYSKCEDPAEACWNGLREENVLDNKGGKTVSNRFCGVIRKMRLDLQSKAQRKWWYLHVALELDMVGSPKFAKLITRGVDLRRSTSAKVEAPEEDALRKACSNQLVVAIMDMMGADAYRIDKIIVTVPKFWECWFGTSNARLRSVHATQPWLKEQLDAKFFNTCFSTFELITKESVLEYCEFVIPNADQMANLQREEVEPEENQMARVFGHLIVAMNFHRLKRCGWLICGWSSRSAFFIEDSARARQEVVAMREDYNNFVELQGMVDDIKGIGPMVAQSPWNTMAQLQVTLS
jgi:hypothetical protein